MERTMKQQHECPKEEQAQQPPGIVTVRIDPATGLLAYPGQREAIFETFRSEYAPTEHATAHAVGAVHHDGDASSAAVAPAPVNPSQLF